MRLISCLLILISVIQIVYVSSHRFKRQNRFSGRQWGGRQWGGNNQFNYDYDQDEFNQGGGFDQSGVNQFNQNQFNPSGSFQQQQQQNQFQFPGQNQNQQEQTTTQPPPTGSPSRAFLSCMGGCQALSHYNPICGTDGQTYHNDQRLGCAQRCGANVQQATIGACPNPNAG